MTTKAEAKAAFLELVKLDLTEYDVLLCYASISRDNPVPNFQKVKMTADLGDHFRDVASGCLGEWRAEMESGNNVEFHPYTEAENPPVNEVEFVSLAENNFLKNQIASLADPTALAVFDQTKEFMRGLHFYVILLMPKNGGEVITCFRKYSSAYELGKKRFAIRWMQNSFDLVAEKAFLFDDRLDCIARGNILFVLRKNDFKKIFRFYDMLKAVAKQALDTISQHVKIDGFEQFAVVCQNHAYRLSMLRDISQQPYLATITISGLKKVIKENALDVKIEGKGDAAALVFNPAHPWAILRLLNDSYFKSRLTNRLLVASSKRERQAGEE